jgi:membrane protease YdiL (CAAX protease family)
VSVTVVAGVVIAAVAWGALFGLGRADFWSRAAVAGLVIGAYAIVAQRGELEDLLRPTVIDVAIGVVAAVVLYGIFWAGNAVLRRWLPQVAAQVDDLYAVRTVQRPAHLPMSAVLLVVGPCEELFWRGLVQARAGFAVALAGYAAVHLWERKAALVLAAVVGGAFWGALFSWRGTLVAPIVSHALWDLAVVIWRPLVRSEGRE